VERGIDSIFKELKMEYTGERFIPLDNLMNDEMAFEHLHRYHSVRELVRDKVVLDIASGEGYGTAILAKPAHKVFGIDIDPEIVRYAQEKYASTGNVEFLIGQAENIPLPDHSIDIVVSYETIEHLDQPTQEKFLKEIKRVLKKGGRLVISTPDKANYSDRYDYTNKFHLKEFTSEEFLGFLKNYFGHVIPYVQGYEVVSAITETEPGRVNSLHITNWERSTHPFSRKYLINICSDRAFSRSPEFSSIVFQVNKDFMQMTDRIVEMEAHILELGAWGRRLEEERLEKEEQYKSKLKEIEEVKNGLYSAVEDLKNKILALEKESEILVRQADIIASLKEQNHNQYEDIRRLASENADKSKIIEDQNENVHNLYAQLDSINQRLAEIYESDGWRVLKRYYNLKGRLLPENSGRYKTLKKIINKLRGKRRDDAATAMSKQPPIAASKNENRAAKIYDVIEFPRFEIPAVSIVIPAYDGWDITYKCLASIKENTLGVSYEVIVGDDASTDETKDINNYIKNIVVIRNEKNLGFLHNCNHAATYAKGKYILFLNNDTEVRPAWLSSMVDLMEKDESIGMTGSKLIYPDGKLQEAGGIIWKDASGWNFGLNQNAGAPEFNYVKEVDYISGASIILRTQLWKEIGGFDKRYTPAYCEDSDLAFEIRKRGYKVVYQPLSEVIHFEGYSHGTDKNEGIKGSEIKAYQKLNNEKFKEKWRNVLLEEHFPGGENVFWARDRSRNRKTILVIDHYVPHFDKDAGSKTVFQYLKLFVSLNMNVKFIGDNFYRHEPYTTVLQQLGIEVLYGPHYANNWRQWILDNHDKFDFVLLNRPHISIKYIDFIKEHTQAKILYYGHDLHFVRLAKQHKIENKKELLEEAEKWKEVELSLFNKADIVLTPSPDERDEIKNLQTQKNVFAISPYIFDTDSAPVYNFSERRDILFIGGFTHAPNKDAVLWFAQEIWPAAKQKIGDAKFLIAGSNVPAEVRSLASEDIHVLGFVTEEVLQNLYSKVKLVVIPLRYGAGVKGKTVEAMFHGVPIVSTEFGLEGLPAGYSAFLKSYDAAEDFSGQVIALYNDDLALQDLSKRESSYINNNFGHAAAIATITSILKINTDIQHQSIASL
jgi:GT2 family glycosyltransferase/ubiquinone/menaquinone biosynthesis C-methylase UbiE